MTTATATRTRKPRPTIADKAEMLVSNAAAWLRCRDRRTGRIVAYGIPSLSEPGKFHLTNGRQCDCKAGQAGRDCCHRTAAARYVAQRKEAAAQAASLAAAMLDDDAAPFTAWLDAVDRAAQLRRDLDDVFGPVAGDDNEPDGGYVNDGTGGYGLPDWNHRHLGAEVK